MKSFFCLPEDGIYYSFNAVLSLSEVPDAKTLKGGTGIAIVWHADH